MNAQKTIKLGEEAAESAFDAFNGENFMPTAEVAFEFIKEVKYELEGDDEAAKNLLAEMECINMQLFRAAYKTKIDELKVKV